MVRFRECSICEDKGVEVERVTRDASCESRKLIIKWAICPWKEGLVLFEYRRGICDVRRGRF